MNGLIVIPAYYPDKTIGGPINRCRNFTIISIKHNVEITTLDTTNQGQRISKVDGIKVFYLKGTKGLDWVSKSPEGFSLISVNGLLEIIKIRLYILTISVKLCFTFYGINLHFQAKNILFLQVANFLNLL